MLEEAVTAARHSKSLTLSGVDMLVGFYMLNTLPKK